MSAARPRVLQIITGLGTGGAEQQLRLLLRHLPYACDVVTLTEPGPVAAGLRADGVRVTDLRMRGNRDVAALPRLVRLIRRGGYDLVHTHLYRACVYGRLAARAAGVRAVVATEHSLGADAIEGRALTRGVRALYLGTERLGGATVAVSETVAARLAEWGVPPSRIETVPNGIDAALFRSDRAARAAVRARLGIAPEAYAIGGVGRLVPGKRFDSLIRAVAAVPGTVALIAGEGPERARLVRLAAALGVTDRVRLPGDCGVFAGEAPGLTVPGVLGALDLFVSPSRDEAFGLAVVEALAAGLPVVYRACPAVADLPPAEVPGARRVGTDDAGLIEAVRDAKAGPPPGRVPAPGVGRYDIRRTAERVAALYDRLLGTDTGADAGADSGRSHEHLPRQQSHQHDPIGRVQR